MRIGIISTVLSLLSIANLSAQHFPDRSTKTLEAQRVQEPPVIDGVLDDSAWIGVPTAKNFYMVEPGNSPERQTHPTQVKVVYDDEAIYIAGYLYDHQPDDILREFTQRDEIGQADLFRVEINTYNDGENHTRFEVTSSGALADAKMKGDSEDYTYDVVWEGEISFDSQGWYVEIKIPYSALRFPDREEQLWSVQFGRQIKHLNEIYTWNYVNKSVGRASDHQGLLRGIRNIDTPVRLSLYPYVSTEVDMFKEDVNAAFKAGMDLKFGLSDAFTLDATLVPDFGQTAFDQVELNLSPFEQEFNENRAFFTEGTELFNKGNLFYSRRIGNSPIGFNAVQQEILRDEVILENPESVNLLNAIKLSGRTDSDLGIGFFNAITERTHALVRDTVSGAGRRVQTQPLTNYNIFVLDQQFNRNSSITLINTNVTREGHFRDANVTGLLFDVANRNNSFRYSGEFKVSQVNDVHGNVPGFASDLKAERTRGNFRYFLAHSFANQTYDINDLGLNFYNNYSNFSGELSYRIFEPKGNYNEFNVSLALDHERRYRPDVATATIIGSRFVASTRSRFYFGGGATWTSDSKDFFEPRVAGHFVDYPSSFGGNFWVSGDYRKPFAYDVRLEYLNFANDRDEWILEVSPRYRFNNRITLVYELNYGMINNFKGFVGLNTRDIIFGKRNTESVENIIKTTYNFNTRQAIDLSFRNFWSVARYDDNAFYSLQADGSLLERAYQYSENTDPNTNFNIWNLDLSFRWRFAPGSEAILLYRNAIFNQDRLSQLSYLSSLENLFDESIRQNISLRVVYFLDYNNLKNILKG